MALKRPYCQPLWLLLTVVMVAQAYFITSADAYWQDLWLSRDQQGHWYFFRGQYRLAASRFDDDEHKAHSYYAAEDFAQAEKIYARQYHARGYFNWANSLAHQEKYLPAVRAYKLALLMQPQWPQAQANLDLVRAMVIKKKSLDENNGGSQGELGADSIAFDLEQQKHSDVATQDEMGIGELGEQQVQELWLRRLNTRPVDFLRRKFAFQYQQQLKQGAETSADDGGRRDVKP